MFRLTREVRFAINRNRDDQLMHAPANGYAGYPSLTGGGQYFELQVTLQGELQAQSNYLRNITEIDDAVRRVVIPAGNVLNITEVFRRLREVFPGELLCSTTLQLSPFLSIAQLAAEYPMKTRLSQKFEFSASHRLHNPELSDAENRSIYGKCNNPFGHGHNYEVQVTLSGKANSSGLIVDVPVFERIVQTHAIEKLDHKNLNVEVSEFKDLIPSVENISKVIFGMLKGEFSQLGVELAAVTVWETPKTWCEYSEDQ